jgi:hypothetical protein
MAVLLKADGTAEEKRPGGGSESFTLEELQALVGGYIELVPKRPGHRMGERMMLADGEGLYKGKPANLAASLIAGIKGGEVMLAGDCLLLSLAEFGE